jgi:hypothetical protein
LKLSVSTNDVKKELLKKNNGIKMFQINKKKLLKSCDSNPNIYSKKISLNRLIGKNSDSKINFKENFYKNYNINVSNNIFKFPEKSKIYNKYKINIDSSINNVNDILFTDNSSSNISNINSYSLLNSKIFNKSNKICLTQQNKDIKFMNIFENNLRKISKNVANSFNLKNN